MPSNGGAKLNYGPIHNNSNLTCAIDIRVGGEDAATSDLLEVAFLPLDHSYKIHPVFKLFHLRMRPSWKVDLRVAKLNQTSIEEYKSSPHDQVGALSLFTRWFEDSLQLKNHKKIIPLAWDWSEIKPYLKMWMGDETFDYHISENHRELKSLVNFVNDRSDVWGDEVPFKQATVSQLLTKLDINLIDKNSLPANCLGMIQSYSALLRRYIPGYAVK